MNKPVGSTKLDNALALLPEEVREHVLRFMVEMDVDLNDPAFAWAIAAGHIQAAIDKLPAEMRAEGDAQLKAFKELFDTGHDNFAAETVKRLKAVIDKSVAGQSQGIADKVNLGIKAECRKLDDAGGKLGTLVEATDKGMNEALARLKRLPDNFAKSIIETALIEKLPTLIEAAVRDKLVSQEKTKRALSVALIGGIVLFSAIVGGSAVGFFEWRARTAEKSALEAAQTALVNQKLGEAREVLALAKPFDSSLRDPMMRARLEWAQQNPQAVDIMKSDAGASLRGLVNGYKGAEDVKAPFPCVVMGPRMNINGTVVAHTCTVALPNE